MRIVAVLLAFVVLLLAAVFLAMDAGLTPHVDLANIVLPAATAGCALLLLLALLLWRPKVAPVAAPVAAAPSTRQVDAEVVHFLSLLQEKGRLVDFLMDDIAGYSDAEVGAAGRVLHEGCKAVLREHFAIRPLRSEAEGSKVVVPTGYAADEYRLVGAIRGEAPFTGTLVHHGWKTDWVKLPRLTRQNADQPPALAPAEIELK